MKYTVKNKKEAYILGLLWGDGWLQKPNKNYETYYPHIQILKEDFNNIKDIFTCYGNWKIYDRNRKNRKPQRCAYLVNSEFGLFLKQLDYRNKSTVSPSKILSIIPENLKSYWWRGYIDADGCFYVNKKNSNYQFCLTSTKNQNWDCTEQLFKKIGIKSYRIYTQDNGVNACSRIRITNKKDIKILGLYLYGKEYDNFGLNRKHQKYSEII